MRVWMRDKCYWLRFVRVPARGCDGIVKYWKREIRIGRGLRGKKRLELLIHEPIHACLPDLNEEAVDHTARAISDLLYALGYRAKSAR